MIGLPENTLAYVPSPIFFSFVHCLAARAFAWSATSAIAPKTEPGPVRLGLVVKVDESLYEVCRGS